MFVVLLILKLVWQLKIILYIHIVGENNIGAPKIRKKIHFIKWSIFPHIAITILDLSLMLPIKFSLNLLSFIFGINSLLLFRDIVMILPLKVKFFYLKIAKSNNLKIILDFGCTNIFFVDCTWQTSGGYQDPMKVSQKLLKSFWSF